MMKKVKHPCMSCKYFMICGSTTRTEECNGREVNGRKKNERSNEVKRGRCA